MFSHADHMKPEVAIALISVGGTLGATITTFVGTAFLQRQKSRREERADRGNALREVLTAATSFAAGVQLFRSGWVEGPSPVDRVFRPPRKAMSDMDALLMPKLERLSHASIRISMWPEKKDQSIKDAVIQLADAAGDLVNAMADKASVYEERKDAFQKTLGHLRRAIDG